MIRYGTTEAWRGSDVVRFCAVRRGLLCKCGKHHGSPCPHGDSDGFRGGHGAGSFEASRHEVQIPRLLGDPLEQIDPVENIRASVAAALGWHLQRVWLTKER